MRRRQLGNGLMMGGLLLIAAALLLTGYNLWDENRAGRSVETILTQLPGNGEFGENGAGTGTGTEPGYELGIDMYAGDGYEADGRAGYGAGTKYGINPSMIPDYLLNPDMEMPTVNIDGNDYIGALHVPALGLTLPVMSDWTMEQLKLSPCRYSGSAYTRDLVIAGHNYRRHFSGLKTLSAGERMLFTDLAGNRFVYEIAETEVLGPEQVQEMTDSEWDLTLFTCTYGGQSRFTLRCRLLP